MRLAIAIMVFSSYNYSLEKVINVKVFCNLENIFYLWYLSKVAQKKRFPIFRVFPGACRGSTWKTAHTYVTGIVMNNLYNLSCLARF